MMGDIAVCDRLIVARARLERAKRYVGDYAPSSISESDYATCPVCLVGAVNYAHTGTSGAWPELEVLCDVIGIGVEPESDYDDLIDKLSEWADAMERTKGDLLAALDAAIEATAPK